MFCNFSVSNFMHVVYRNCVGLRLELSHLYSKDL